MISNPPQRFAAEGNLTDEKTKDYIRRLLRSLVELTQRMQSNLKADGSLRTK